MIPAGFIKTKSIGVKYGYLYNWYIAEESNILPNDWAIPTALQINTLRTLLTVGASGDKLKEIGFDYWFTGNLGTNEYGYNFRGSGDRDGTTGSFSGLKEIGGSHMSSSAIFSASYNLGYSSVIARDDNDGYSIRGIYNGAGIPDAKITDYDGNTYDVVQIGTQYWMAQNYACTHLSDGTPINKITDNTTWANDTAGAYCAYDNDENNVFK